MRGSAYATGRNTFWDLREQEQEEGRSRRAARPTAVRSLRRVEELPGGYPVCLKLPNEDRSRFDCAPAFSDDVMAAGLGHLEFFNHHSITNGRTYIEVTPDQFNQITGGAK